MATTKSSLNNTRAGEIFEALQQYTGAALLGCISFGLLFTYHSAHPDRIRLAGSALAMLCLSVIRYREAHRSLRKT